MRKILLIALVLLFSYPSVGQSKIFPIGFTPALNKTINGIGIGLTLNSFKKKPNFSKINGLSIELIGLAPISPFLSKRHWDILRLDTTGIQKGNPESILKAYEKAVYTINGISFSTFGVNAADLHINGFNLALAGTATGKVNGASIAIIFNTSAIVNGVSAGFINEVQKIRGVQIGVINNTCNLNGIQIGLWNINQKRKLPFINWNFD
jgi:hypothetical protein